MTMSRTKSGIDPEIIRELANLLTETDLTEIEVQQADLRIRVARQINVTVPVTAPTIAAPAASAAASATPVAARSGTVTALFIEDKQPVEYGQPLMIIE